mmetsp:Transcript_29145/g.73604  ORF Transcript_29145/g.73604 Transcript_29145/m.73604 type:complete len:277 (+) Transcript_29145:811-1641(+)
MAVVPRGLAPLTVDLALILGLRVPRVVEPEVHIGLLPRRGVEELRLGSPRDVLVLPLLLRAAVEPELSLAELVPLEVEFVVHVVHHDVDDDIHSKPVGRSREVAELLEGAEAAVEQREVVHGVLVVHVLAVLEDRGDPDGLAAQSFDVGQLLGQPDEVTAVPVRHVAHVEAPSEGLVVARISISEAVRQQLVDREGSPIGRRGVVSVISPLTVVLAGGMPSFEVDIPTFVLSGAWRARRRASDHQQQNARERYLATRWHHEASGIPRRVREISQGP